MRSHDSHEIAGLPESAGLRGVKVLQRVRRWIAIHREDLRAPDDAIAFEEREDGPDTDRPRELVRHQHPRAREPALTRSKRRTALKDDDRVVHDRLDATSALTERHRRAIPVEDRSASATPIGRNEVERQPQHQGLRHGHPGPDHVGA